MQPMAVVCTRPGKRGKVYLATDGLPADLLPDEDAIRRRIAELCRRTGLIVPDEPINPVRPSPNARGLSAVTRHGLKTFGDLFTPRQMLCLLTFAAAVREAHQQMQQQGYDPDRARAVGSYLGLVVDKMADYSNTLSRWGNDDEGVTNAFSRQALPMVWDFAEAPAWSGSTGGISWCVEYVTAYCDRESQNCKGAIVCRGTATALPWSERQFDAVITDPPYYDNVPYADISDFFYVWLKRTIVPLYLEHFSSELTLKKSEATALASRHGGDMERACRE
jgi:putative DNA methylase